MKRAILFTITVCLCYGSFVNGYSQTGRKQSRPQQKTSKPQTSEQANKPPSTQTTKAKSTSPDTIAQAMVNAVKDTHLGGSLGFLDRLQLAGDEKAALGNADAEAFAIALETTGRSLTQEQTLQGMFAFGGFFMSRRPLTPAKVADYLTRFRAIDKATVDKWQAAVRKSDESAATDPSIALAWIAFHDFLFEGGQWKKGNPDRAIARLASLTKEAVSRWKTAVGTSDALDAAWDLLAVDDLFINDTFQPSVFDVAFPVAQKLLSAR